jgi:hypothetical protein
VTQAIVELVRLYVMGTLIVIFNVSGNGMSTKWVFSNSTVNSIPFKKRA